MLGYWTEENSNQFRFRVKEMIISGSQSPAKSELLTVPKHTSSRWVVSPPRSRFSTKEGTTWGLEVSVLDGPFKPRVSVDACPPYFVLASRNSFLKRINPIYTWRKTFLVNVCFMFLAPMSNLASTFQAPWTSSWLVTLCFCPVLFGL